MDDNDQNRKTITLRFLLDTLKDSSGSAHYDLVLPDTAGEHTLLWRCAVEILKAEPPPPYVPPSTGMVRVVSFPAETRETQVATEIYPLAADILWQLCLRSYLRPGARGPLPYYQRPSGQGYSLTLRGRQWVKAVPEEEFLRLLTAL